MNKPKTFAELVVPVAYGIGVSCILSATYFLIALIDDYKGLLEVSCIMIFVGVLIITGATLTKNHPKDER